MYALCWKADVWVLKKATGWRRAGGGGGFFRQRREVGRTVRSVEICRALRALVLVGRLITGLTAGANRIGWIARAFLVPLREANRRRDHCLPGTGRQAGDGCDRANEGREAPGTVTRGPSG